MSSPFTSYNFNDSFNEGRGKADVAIDRAIAGLQKCLHEYEEKAKSCDSLLEKLGFTVKDLPDDVRTNLKEIFKDDNGVFNFQRADSETMVTINTDHVLNSLQEKYELGQLRMLRSQMETLLEEFGYLDNNLERKLLTEKEKSDKLESETFEKEAEIMMFRGRLEAAQRELESLQRLSQMSEKPKYSLEDLESLNREVNKLKSEIAFTKTKLDKYNQLPLSEKDALKQLVKLRGELKEVDNEIKKKINY